MISIIICSVSELLREEIKVNIKKTIGIEHEIIIIKNEIFKYPIAKAYNTGAAIARYPYLCFSHEDVFFHTPNWGQILIRDFKDSGARLIGVLGSTIKTKHPGSVYIGDSKLNRQNHIQRHPYKSNTLSYENPNNEVLAEVCILDGLFIASTKRAWEETKFSEEYLASFHGYDIDYSIKNFLLGKIIVTYNILLEHFSHGSFSVEWLDTQIMLSKKWKDKLPLMVSGTSNKDAADTELYNLRDLIALLIKHNYRSGVQWKYFISYFRRSPIDKSNIYYFRRFLLRNRVNQALKLFLKPSHKPS